MNGAGNTRRPAGRNSTGDGPAVTGPGTGVDAVVTGRVGVDLYPAETELRKPLREIDHYDRSVGGFAGNVATGMARLGLAVAIASRVGDDGHGEYVRDWLAAEGIDVRWLATDPEYRTPVTFCEI